MKAYLKTKVSILILCSFLGIFSFNTGISGQDMTINPSAQFFIERLYQVCLNREADQAGLTWWLEEKCSGAQLAESFILSEEMANKNLSDEAYIHILYTALMGRESDTSGVAFWKNYLENGVSRKGVLSRFVTSPEYQTFCTEYALPLGEMTPLEIRDEKINFTFFLMQQYRCILGRDADDPGINHWIKKIIDGETTVEKVAGELLFSQEAVSVTEADDVFVSLLYRYFMEREPEQGELEYWTTVIANKEKTRESLYEDFAYGEYYKNRVIAAGIEPSERPKPIRVRAAVQVVLTFDDGPGPYTGQVLDMLKERDVPATFFVQGGQAETRPDMIKRMVAEGHIVANHTYNHPTLTRISQSSRRWQIDRTDEILRSLGAPTTPYLRPPGGSYNATVCADAGKPMILWDVDPRDWEVRNTNTVINRVLNGAKDGSIILLHDVHLSTVNAVPTIIDEFIKRGVQIIPLDEMLSRNGTAPVAGGVYSSGR